MIGKQLAHYEVIDNIGAGGMGEVFRARDTKLGREVALKVLPAAFADDAERLARFKREAQLLAAFNHPHIATLYGFEQSDGTHFLAMELVDGVDIAQRLENGPLPQRESLRIAADVAEALEAAHAQGIVHRDLKPANIKLTADERVKVLDFGLAKAISGDAPGVRDVTHSPTITSAGTVGGVILGTAAYMSPEQARGKPVDKLSDIWALGCVLFEMLTGRRAFAGETISDTLVRLLEHDPDWAMLPADTPPAVQHLLRRCLKKDKRQRMQDVGDARIELRDCLSGTSEVWNSVAASAAAQAPSVVSGEAATVAAEATADAASGGRAPRSRAWMLWIAVALAAGVGLGVALAPRFQSPVRRPTMRVSIIPPAGSDFVPMGDFAGPATLSHDGTKVAFTAIDSTAKVYLWVRAVADVQPRRIEETEGATFPFWSPDGRSIGFFADERLKRVEIAGGSPITIAEAPNGRGGSWNQDDAILYAPEFQSDLFLVPAAGGVPARATSRDTTLHTTHRWPRFLPDGQSFLYVAGHHDQRRAVDDGVYYSSLGGESRRVLEASTEAVFTMDHLLYVHDNTLMAVRFDATAGSVSGNAKPLVDKVRFDPSTWKAALSASQNGMLAYHSGTRGSDQGALTVFDRSGNLLHDFDIGERHVHIAVSPDGSRIVASVGESMAVNLWLYDLDRETRTRLTFHEDGAVVTPRWSPDGNTIAYSLLNAAGSNRFYTISADGGNQELIHADEGPDFAWLTDWSSDGRFLLFARGDYVGNRSDIWLMRLEDGGETQPLLQQPYYTDRAQFSPDGRWVAYRSDDESGRANIFVSAFEPPAPGKPASLQGKWLVSSPPGATVDWSADGKQIHYLTLEGDWMAAPVDASAGQFRVGRVEKLFNCNPWYLGRIVCSASRDGQLFAATTHRIRNDPPVTLVVDWMNELNN